MSGVVDLISSHTNQRDEVYKATLPINPVSEGAEVVEGDEAVKKMSLSHVYRKILSR
jgi:hypothetical protein